MWASRTPPSCLRGSIDLVDGIIVTYDGRSTRDSADRNNALAYFMREQGCFPDGPNNNGGGVDIKNILDFYFQVCIFFCFLNLNT